MKNIWKIAAFLLAGAVFVSCVKDDDTPPPEPPEPGELELIHYWHFNELPDGTLTDPVDTDFSVPGLSANITYPGTGDGYVDTRTHREADPVSNFNLRLNQPPDVGATLRMRNPADTREMIFTIPTTGYTDLVFTFATTRTGNGAQQQEFYYSADGGTNWTQLGSAYVINHLEVDFYLERVIDLSEVEALNDNPNTRFRILFVGEEASNTSGNNRFDNVSLDGIKVAR